MDIQDLRQSIGKIEERVDEAHKAVQQGNAPQELRQSVDQLHQQARQAKQSGSSDENALRQQVMQLEQAADRARQACRTAGSQADAPTQQAVQRAHDEISQLKKQLQAGAAA